MLVVIPVFWMVFAFGPVGGIDSGSDGTQLRAPTCSSSVSMTGKPIKIPPKKV